MGSSRSKQQPDETGAAAAQRRKLDLTQMPARVDRVNISGLQRTYDDYVKRAVHNCFDAKTFQELLMQVADTKANLNELGIFKDLHVIIDVSRGTTATECGYEVSFEGKELTRLTGTAGTQIGQNEGSLIAELATPNIMGRGERMTLHGSYSNAKSSDINVKFSKPFYHTALGYYKPEVSLSLFKNTSQFPWFKYTTHDLGVMFDYSFQLPASIRHSFQYEFAVREIGQVSKQVPFSIREHCGPRLVSILRHICAYDQRDSSTFPTRGIFVKMTNEMSGLGGGGNVAYVKNTTHAEINVPLFAGWSAQLCGRVGILQSDKLAERVPMSSLFILGGPLTVRGFNMAGIGQHTDGVATGAQTFWASGLHLWAPLPFHRHFGMLSDHLRMHGFVTMGNINAFTLDACRCTVGAGLAIRIGERARIELNYCQPVWKEQTDSAIKDGFQFGIGYEFL